MKTIALIFVLIGVLLMGASTTTDYTQVVYNSERLTNVFEGIDVSNTNMFQSLFIELCMKVKSCGA